MFLTCCYPGGKSAVLTALTIALGGKAASTGRGNGLKSFIKEGKTYVHLCRFFNMCFVLTTIYFSWSEVTVTIKNEGSEAFKPEVYGHLIEITRRFTIEGSSGYKIKGKDGKVISTKREDLTAICDHMNIQVDNPINILSQGSYGA